MPSIVFVPILYIGLMYFFLGVMGFLGVIIGLTQANSSTVSAPNKTKTKQKTRKTSMERKPDSVPTHRYNLRSRTRKGPKHRPAFGGLMEI